jgi:outer membrane protein assembly factor BamE (lipoprotein component of BamABCDE complex)
VYRFWTALVLSVATLLSGCVMGSQKEGRVIDAALVLKLKPGATTKQEVLDLFGPPTVTTRALAGQGLAATLGAARPAGPEQLAAEDIYTYEYKEDNERFFTAILLYTWFQRVKLVDTLMVVFGPQDVVKYVAYTKQTEAELEKKAEPDKDGGEKK